jgi:hypothetical protein
VTLLNHDVWPCQRHGVQNYRSVCTSLIHQVFATNLKHVTLKFLVLENVSMATATWFTKCTVLGCTYTGIRSLSPALCLVSTYVLCTDLAPKRPCNGIASYPRVPPWYTPLRPFEPEQVKGPNFGHQNLGRKKKGRTEK